MRLIDADRFKGEIAAVTARDNLVTSKCNAMCELIDRQPTAFDVDKVMRRLDELKSGLTTWAEDEAYKLGIEKAIEIIGAEMER